MDNSGESEFMKYVLTSFTMVSIIRSLDIIIIHL